jgi:tol-pal system protein YbgF
MAPRVSMVGLAVFASLASAPGCVTPDAAATTTTTAASSTTTKPAVSDPEVVLLRERVARLEKRLADVDGKLALLLARADTAPPAAPATTTPRVTRPVERSPTPARVDDGLTSIDIERTPARADAFDDGGIVEVPPAPTSSGDDDDGATVVLKMHGDAAPVIERSGGGVGGDDDPLGALRSAKDLYAWGQARLKEARYVEAVAAFEDVVGRFPKDDLADNSLYWIGVCHQGRGEHRLAIAEWQKLPARFPKSPKIPDALFGMAQSHEALGEPAVAEVLYDEIVASYPKAEKWKEAKKAIARLRPSR